MGARVGARLEQTWQAWAQGNGSTFNQNPGTGALLPYAPSSFHSSPCPRSRSPLSQVRQASHWLRPSSPVTHLPEAKFVSSRGHILPPALIGRLG